MTHTFPVLSDKPDSKHYNMKKEDPAAKNKMEGGYVTSRPKFTRKPRRTFTIGYSTLRPADMKALEDFWDEVKGSSSKFTWLNQMTGESIVVRFTAYWDARYVGKGLFKAWDVSGIILVEA